MSNNNNNIVVQRIIEIDDDAMHVYTLDTMYNVHLHYDEEEEIIVYRLTRVSCFIIACIDGLLSIIIITRRNNMGHGRTSNGVHFQIRICCTRGTYCQVIMVRVLSMHIRHTWVRCTMYDDDTSHLLCIVASEHVSIDSGRTTYGTISGTCRR